MISYKLELDVCPDFYSNNEYNASLLHMNEKKKNISVFSASRRESIAENHSTFGKGYVSLFCSFGHFRNTNAVVTYFLVKRMAFTTKPQLLRILHP